MVSASGKEYKSVPSDEKAENEKEVDPPDGLGVRHLQALILFLSLTTGYAMRAQLSVSIVVMTSDDTLDCGINELKLNNSEVNNGTLERNISNYLCEDDTSWSVYRTYKWSKAVQEMIMFSFFVGYTTMQIPMGIFAQKFGGKITIMVALAVNSLVSLLTPWLPLFGGWLTVCAGRLIQGLTQAAFYPGIHTLLGKWAPLRERGRLSTYIYTGSSFGTILGFSTAGYFASSSFLQWPATFWFFGVLALICFILMSWFGASSPEEHPSISTAEVQYIAKNGTADSNSTRRKTPWKQILMSKAVWGLFATHIGSGFGYIMVLTQIPLYMTHVLHVDIKDNGILSSMPYIALYVVTLFFGYLSDLFINRKIVSVKNVRRIFNSIGTMVSIVFLIAFSFVQDKVLAVILLILSVSLHAGIQVGFNINQIDLAPNFSGTLMSIGNMLCNCFILLCPVLVSYIVEEDMTNQGKWQIVFIIAGLFEVLTNLVFIIFIKDKVQTWNYADTDDEYKEVMKLEKQISKHIKDQEEVVKS